MEPIELEEILVRVRQALAEQHWDQAVALVEALRPADQADVFIELPSEDQDDLLPRLDPVDSADILEELEDEEAAEVAARQDTEELARIIAEMEPDEAADLLGDIEPRQAADMLAILDDADVVEPFLAYPDESAGGKMTAADIALRADMTVEEAIAYLRLEAADSETFYYLFVVDGERRLVGVVSLRQLVVTPPTARIGDIMDPDVFHVNVLADQEEAARLMVRYDLGALPVIDDQGRLAGLITHDDVMDVIEEEATEDIYRLGGVPEEQPADAPTPSALRARLPWLVLNLGTAMISATVLGLFEETIAQVAVLAAFFPIVAGVSGSAATQALTVTVRGLALGEVTPRDAAPRLTRELLIGLTNGMVVGGLIAAIALVWIGRRIKDDYLRLLGPVNRTLNSYQAFGLNTRTSPELSGLPADFVVGAVAQTTAPTLIGVANVLYPDRAAVYDGVGR
ncbi:MAG: magnesium transporter [Chloroflexi bacterium]|nr:magnesium transporter [Chloroflexota bacterium]